MIFLAFIAGAFIGMTVGVFIGGDMVARAGEGDE